MIMYDRLLVPVDRSDASLTAARYALQLADSTGAAVDVLHVVEVGRGASAPRGDEHTTTPGDHERKLLSNVERMADDVGLEITTELREGIPHEAIVEYAAEQGTQLIVMGRHGAANVSERLLGGVTEKVLRAGALPTLTLWTGSWEEGGIDADRVMLPTDGSDYSELAGEHAATLADLAGATVHVVSIADTGAAGGLFDTGGASEEFMANVEARHEEAVSRLADDVEKAVGRPVERAVVRGQPVAALQEYVEENQIDLIVMGSHGRTGFSRWLLGSTTERLLRTVDVPVLVVPRGQ